MSLNWETFKNASSLSDDSLTYIDDEGSEIPIGSDCEFQEALRLAKLSKSKVKFILYQDEVKFGEKINSDQPQQSVTNDSEKLEGVTKNCMNSNVHNNNMKDKSCCCHGDVPPKWFLLHMKKFEKEILHKLKSQIHDIVYSMLEKEKNISWKNSEGIELFHEKNENSFSTQNKKKKKITERDLSDLMDQRGIKLQKKLEKLKAKSERFEKLENKTRMLLEENKGLLDKKRHLKSKLDKNLTEKKNQVKKSWNFQQNGLYTFLPPGSKFAVSLKVINDGKVRWSAARLQCFESKGLSLEENEIILPRLLPMESSLVVVKGRVSQSPGLHYVKCKVVDGSECFGPEFTYFVWVSSENPEKTKESKDKEVVQTSDEANFIEFEKDILTSSQRKIEENIQEIERRLHDIDLLRSFTTEPDVKTNSGNQEMNETDYNMMFEGEEKHWKERLAEEKLFGNEDEHLKNVKEKDKINERNDKNSEKDGELESSLDSMMSLSFMFKDNFVFVPSRSSSPALSANEERNFQFCDMKEKSPSSKEEVQRRSIKPETQERIQKDETATLPKNLHQNQLSPTRSRRSSFGEETSKPKKMKSDSTKYRFTTVNLTEPTFRQVPVGRSSSKFNFTGEKKGDKINGEEGNSDDEAEERPWKFTFTGAEDTSSEDDSEDNVEELMNKFKTDDKTEKVIYAVNGNGYCFPVEKLKDEI